MATRCGWCGEEPLYIDYHDREWGVPVRDDRTLFEFLILEGAQAGLSWWTVLQKREGYRRAFAGFDPAAVATFTDEQLAALRNDAGIVRNRAKIASARSNARAFLDVQAEYGRFSDYLWGFVNGQPVINHWQRLDQVPATTPLSDALSTDLKRRGFKFVGSTICYAYLQAVGVVMDHVTDCFRHAELAGATGA
ncbi:DNA-3-methyladenine glycosylase I [Spectribacter hydrogenoxidans]|uniref:DNA-3-methyladenine glycosylase I n=1 Tax=Spectribacter hydrogenoxidans TaxID=3075608 RepID=A0ABU3BWH2_9GAMM|nr:DNA-3-methyladenine glycosylase I [Salinisphaera sp. W335]MDT0633622.1 DNA-3-methyladenine glycosylase I [Salinisphaera sp. W335]